MRSLATVAVTIALVLLALSSMAGAEERREIMRRPPVDVSTGRAELREDLGEASAVHLTRPGDPDARHSYAQLSYEAGDFANANSLVLTTVKGGLVDCHLAEFVDENGPALARGFALEQIQDDGRLPDAEEAGEYVCWDIA